MSIKRIETYETLWGLVDLDREDHLIKDLTKLFLSAMSDWPTCNQENISAFISELKAYFGEPLNTDRIESKLFNGMNAWQIESSGSLLEMHELWDKYYGPIELDTLIEKLLSHYNREYADFIAELYYLPTEEGGRKNPAASGYRPQVKFDFAEYQTSGKQTFIDKEIVYPGDTVTAKIIVISPEILEGKLEEGTEFDFLEGLHLIGTGKVKYVINDKLEKEIQHPPQSDNKLELEDSTNVFHLKWPKKSN